MNMQRITRFTFAVGVLLLAMLPSSARADGGGLSLSAVTGSAGQEITVYGTISNSGGDTLYLNGESFTLGSSNFTDGDVTDFFNNAPFFLSSDSNSGSIALFSFLIAPGTPSGVYSGNALQILGGLGSADQNLIASANFTIDVTGGKVPEPSGLILLGFGLTSLTLLRRRCV